MQKQADEGTWRIHVGERVTEQLYTIMLSQALEHCIDSIREFIMCKADMTPIVLVPPGRSGVPVPVPEFRTVHVCRNYEKLLQWAKNERDADLEDEQALEIASRIRQKTGAKS